MTIENGLTATVTTEIKPTPKEVADIIWGMYSDEQAEMLSHLLEVAGGEHNLMMQFMGVRDDCDENGLAAFQSMFASAYKHMW